MLTMQPLDPQFPISEQLNSTDSPVILVNIFKVDPNDIDALLSAWEDDANWMKKQPGYISTQLHRAIAGSSMFLNYAVWESVELFRAAFSSPEFHSRLNAYPSSTIAQPHLFTRVAIPNLCTE